MTVSDLEAADPRVAELVAAESARQHDTLRLIPSENYVSPAVLEASGSVLTNKYSEGYPAKRYYEGNAVVDDVETLATERARALFGADHANVQPLSGAPANLAVYAAFLAPGDTVLGMALDAGGHLTHGHGVSITGRWFRAVRYGVRRDTGTVDLDEVRELALRERPRLIWCGGTAIPRTIDFAGFAAIADEVDAVLAADIAHIAGLVAGGAHPTPVGHADVVTTTTHKTLRGPRGAMVLCDAPHATALDRAVFPGLQGGPHDHTTAAIAVALHEAAQPAFAATPTRSWPTPSRSPPSSARAASTSSRAAPTTTSCSPTSPSKGVGGRPAAEGLERAGLVCNYNAVPFDPRQPMDPSGIRLGTPAITTRGLGVEHMSMLARWIDEAVEATRSTDAAALDRIAGEVRELARAFPPPA